MLDQQDATNVDAKVRVERDSEFATIFDVLVGHTFYRSKRLYHRSQKEDPSYVDLPRQSLSPSFECATRPHTVT